MPFLLISAETFYTLTVLPLNSQALILLRVSQQMTLKIAAIPRQLGVVSYETLNNEFLMGSKKMKGDRYVKHFRIDGALPASKMHDIARVFFPVEELYDEAFDFEQCD
jgi:hypothetical protein